MYWPTRKPSRDREKKRLRGVPVLGNVTWYESGNAILGQGEEVVKTMARVTGTKDPRTAPGKGGPGA